MATELDLRALIAFAREVAGDWEHEGRIKDTDLYVDLIVRLAAAAESQAARLAVVEQENAILHDQLEGNEACNV